MELTFILDKEEEQNVTGMRNKIKEYKLRRRCEGNKKASELGPLKSAPVCPNLIGLRAGEASSQWSTTGRQRSCERGAAVGQEGLQVAEEQVSIKD